ncbi:MULTISPECIES: TetR/AcrR family transcriptional regulator [Bacillus]|uniref:TetR/AcrR family transcriptional regulator n=1 Tax=Bacillus TaxID=1386 RepID=UPI0010132AF6|nr:MULTISPECIES: TetR/AcrR family transcriptional regulator [Bacillus]MCY8426509.1 TetR/AcrR family transcriptional regulator [Bacillus vallismortis]UQE77718.1 TetR/AcrR family transcriptional regulator [Bacillus cabrialesii]
MARQAEASKKTKDKIVKVARELFIKKGYSETSLQEILTAGKISKGNLYHHFKGKEFLYLYIIEQDYLEWELQWKKRESHCKNAIEKLYDLTDFSLQMNFNSPLIHVAEEFFASAFKSKEVIERILEIDSKYSKMIRNILEEGNHDGSWSISNLDLTTQIVSSLFYGLEITAQGSLDEEKEKLYRESARVLIEGLK